MERVRSSDKSLALRGGAYFTSLSEMNSPRHQAMHALLVAIKKQDPARLVKAMSGAQAAGWDINTLVFQDSLDSWYMLGAYLASQPTLAMGNMLSAYLDFPGVDVSTQEGFTHTKYLASHLRAQKSDPEAFQYVTADTRVPMSHAFLRQWAQHLSPPAKRSSTATDYQHHKAEKYLNLHEVAVDLFGKMSARGADWYALDEHGNGLCHVLIERESSHTLEHLLPWMKSLGVSMSSQNNHGITPSVAAQHRIARAIANWEGDEAQLKAFKNTLSILERNLLDETTPAVSVNRPSRRF